MGLAVGGQLVEVPVEVRDDLDRLLGRHDVASQVGILGAEHLLGELDHPRVVGLGQSEDRQDDLQGVREGDVLVEVGFTAERLELVDGLTAELVEPVGQAPDARRLEPVVGELAVLGVVGLVHMDEGADLGAARGPHRELRVASEDRDRRVGEIVRPPLDVEHCVVADDRPEGLVARLIDPVDRAAGVELDCLTSPAVEIAVAVWVGEQVGHDAPLDRR